MEHARHENILTAIFFDGSPILRLRRLISAIVLISGAFALLIHGSGLLL